MRSRYIIWAAVLLLSACTAYRNNVKATGDEKISSYQLKELSVNDKVNILLTSGQSFRGKVISIGEEYIMVKVNKERDQTIYFSQIKRIKYDVNEGVTALKVTGAAALVSLILLLLFPPQIEGPLLGF
jgi:hypothetical protein